MQVASLHDAGVPIWGPTYETRSLLATGTWDGNEHSKDSIIQISNYSITKGICKC